MTTTMSKRPTTLRRRAGRFTALALGAAALATTLVPTSSAQAATPQPVGFSGGYALSWQDEFSGGSLDGSRWSASYCGSNGMNGVKINPSNTSVGDGVLSLRLSDAKTGAQVTTATDSCDAPSKGSVVRPGQVIEWRAKFAASGGRCLNWAAVWVAGPNWPRAGEHDVAEVLDGGSLTGNYHNQDYVRGSATGKRWYTQPGCDGGWHTYSLDRRVGSAKYRIDGKVVASGTTPDNTDGESVIMTVGKAEDEVTSYSKPLQIDYVRVWSSPASLV